MSPRVRATLRLGVALVATLAVVCLLGDGLSLGAALFFAPIAVMVGLLAAGRYTGERLIEAWQTRRAGRRRAVPSVLGARRRSAAPVIAGGRLIGRALAQRGPPRAAPAT